MPDNDIEIYSTHNKGKIVFVERPIRTLKKKIYKHMIEVTTDVCVDKLDGIVEKYKKMYLKTIK